jgi:hypothetical protein
MDRHRSGFLMIARQDGGYGKSDAAWVPTLILSQQ